MFNQTRSKKSTKFHNATFNFNLPQQKKNFHVNDLDCIALLQQFATNSVNIF